MWNNYKLIQAVEELPTLIVVLPFNILTYLCNLVNETNLAHILFLVYFINFIYNLYMFWTSLGPSSGEATVSMRHLALATLYSWLSGM